MMGNFSGRNRFDNGDSVRALKTGVALTMAGALLLVTGCRTVVVQTQAPAQPAAPASYADVVSRVTPAVVSVHTRRKLSTAEAEAEALSEERSTEHPDRTMDKVTNALPHELEGLGSGVVIAPNGYILTSAHVIDKASQITVSTAAGDEMKAQVVGIDRPTDIAVLKIAATNLPTVRFADSSKLRVGDVVLAVGNPLGVGETVTSGIVSATRRGGLGLTDYEEFIQTDAPLNPGNSGGALVDAHGRLVGISIAILTTGGGFEGIGLAVPVNLARSVMEQLLRRGRVIRGYLGVSLHSLPPELAKAFGLPGHRGALVVTLAPGSPASRAGLASGDIVMAFNGQPVESAEDLRINIARAAPGSRVHLQIRRPDGERRVSAVLAEMPARAPTP